MRVTVSDGDSIESYAIMMDATVLDLKRMIKHMKGIEISRQTLRSLNGRVLTDDFSLYEDRDSTGSLYFHLDVEPLPAELHVTVAGQELLNFTMTSNATVHDLKMMIKEKTRIDVNRQTIQSLSAAEFADNFRLIEGRDSSGNLFFHLKVEALPISAEINILIKMQIRDIGLRVKIADTVADLKNMIQYKLGILPEKMILRYKHTTMRDDKPLSAYDITEGAEIGLII